ncbi:MAG: HDIG domain-containing protein, partial [Candidatus Eisenbacteria bacterium]|nr:HDIG domain-containing protein [Candidatus Eisenbacteria bacterium]
MEIHWSPAPPQLLKLHQAYAGPKSLVEKLNRAGFEAYLVGGAVRDAILGRPISDWDIATSADPQAMLSIWPRAVPVGIQHGTLLVTEVTPPVEITAFRTEGPYEDQRHPDWVSFGVDLGEDLKRRDFTINALAFDPVNERLADPTGGLADLERGLIRAVGNPDERFREDALRLLRAVRFAATLDFELEPKTKAALSKQADGLKRVAPERIREELLKLLKAERPSKGFRAMKESGLLVHVLPELLEGSEMTQNSYHAHTVFDHILHAVDAAPRDNLRVRLGALFHDIAKPRTQGGVEGERTFYNHEGVGSKLTQEIMTRLRFPKREIEYVSGLVQNHMFYYTDEWSDGTVRRFVNRVGRD